MGLVTATDVDTVGSLQDWQVVGGSGAGVFSIDSLTGQITVTSSGTLDFESVNSWSLVVTVRDGINTAHAESVLIQITNINEAPTIVTNQLSITEGATVVLSAAELNSVDPEQGPGALRYSVTGITAGQFERITAPGTPIASFTQAEVQAGQVLFRHDGSRLAPTYQVTVSDGSLSDGPHVPTINFVILNNAPVGTSDAYVAYFLAPLDVGTPGVLTNDTDADGDSLTAAVAQMPRFGVLSLAANGSFNYVPIPGVIGQDSFQYQVSDGRVWSGPITVQIEIVPIPVAPDDSGKDFDIERTDGVVIVNEPTEDDQQSSSVSVIPVLRQQSNGRSKR